MSFTTARQVPLTRSRRTAGSRFPPLRYPGLSDLSTPWLKSADSTSPSMRSTLRLRRCLPVSGPYPSWPLLTPESDTLAEGIEAIRRLTADESQDGRAAQQKLVLCANKFSAMLTPHFQTRVEQVISFKYVHTIFPPKTPWANHDERPRGLLICKVREFHHGSYPLGGCI